MKRFFSFVIKQSVAVILIVLLVLGLGVWSTIKMSINLLPDINVPIVCVQVIYPGANASSVEHDVTVKVEDGVSSISGITDVTSHSYDNLSAVILSFDYGTDTTEKKTDITNKLSSLGLPSGVTTSVYDVDLNATALATVSLTSEKGLDDAYAKAKELSTSFAAIDGVESVSIKGGPEYAFTITPYVGLELACPLIVQAFSYGALDIPLGNITVGETNVQIRNNSDIDGSDLNEDGIPNDILNMPIELPSELKETLKTIKEEKADLLQMITTPPPYSDTMLSLIGNAVGMKVSNELISLILNLDENTPIRVSDIAKVERTASYTSYAYYSDGEVKINDGKAVIIEVYKANGANSSAVVEKVKNNYNKISSAEGYSAQIHLLDDQSEFISDSISNVLVSMLIGGALAIVIIFVFLKKIRTSLVIAITMPLSVLAALICLSLMGITLNMVSLGGLAVGIGMLVDNSIVVIEAISKHRDGGKSAYESAVDGTCEVGGALFGSTLTTVCVFIPILFAGGLTAEIFTDLAYAVIFSLAFSLIVAVTVIPALYCILEGNNRFIKRRVVPADGDEQLTIDMYSSDLEYNQHSKIQMAGDPLEAMAEGKKKKGKLAALKQPIILNKITSLYSKILKKALAYKLVTILTAVAVFGASIGLLFITGTEFLPSIDKGQIEVTLDYGSGKDLKTVEDDVIKFAETISENVENVDYVSASIGKNGIIALTDTGIITVQLKTNKNTSKTVEKIRNLAKNDDKLLGNVSVREIDGVVASLMSGSTDMSVTIVGNDEEKLKEIAKEIETRLKAEKFEDVKDSSTEKSTQYTLKFDRAKMLGYGLDYQTDVMTLRIGIASYTACTVTISDSEYNLNVQFDGKTIKNQDDLKNFVVGFNGSTPIKLTDILKDGKIIEEKTDACITRYNGNKMITVSGVLPDTDTGTATDIMKKVAKDVLKEYDGYSFSSSGISSYLSDAFEGLAVALVISFVLLYGVMAVQFGSFIKPLIIMASIPFSFTGGFIALTITRTSLNVVSFIGLIMLMGIIVNNAIVMLEKIKQLKGEGMPHFEAVKKACGERLRPILMTTLTTVLALIPLAIGIGKGSELMSPLGIVVIGGLLLGTLVTLVLVPAVYCAVHRLSEKYPDGKIKIKK
ncbi:MAG: efflux RND transporter permease subunit [Clostridia bacterium]|nr:efflux RND transporter permease subunit [Clostridia bacterium]